MRTMKKSIFCLLLILVMLCGALPLCAFAMQAPAQDTHAMEDVAASNNASDAPNGETNSEAVIIKDGVEYAKGKDFVLQNLEMLDNGMLVFTQEVSETDTVLDESRGYPEKEKTKVFSHKIVDRNGAVMAIVYSTVTGVYSEVEHTAYLTSISGNPTGEFAYALSCSSSISGNTGSLNVYLHGVLACSLSYKIETNGTIQEI